MRVGLTALRGSNPLSSANSIGTRAAVRPTGFPADQTRGMDVMGSNTTLTAIIASVVAPCREALHRNAQPGRPAGAGRLTARPARAAVRAMSGLPSKVGSAQASGDDQLTTRKAVRNET